MKKSLSIIVLAAASCAVAHAQTVHRCGTQNVYEYNASKNSGYAATVEHAFDYAKNYAQQHSANKTSWDTIYRIPVVVHVVYNTPTQNIHDSLIYNQIEVLNQDYRRLNADTGDTRDLFMPVAADAGIEFYLATVDPEGNPTSGITRTATDTPFFSVIGDIFSGGTENGADRVKKTTTGGIDAWDTDNYLNLWVCNLNDPNSFFGLVLGFAYPPDNAPNWPVEAFVADSSLHGVVIHYEVFGRNNPLAVGQLEMANRGRTVVHEVGHYLGLRHIWGDGPLSILFPDCDGNDGIDDTPTAGNNSQATGCDTTKNTCTDGSSDLPDMFENYMDYSREECQNVFTFGQVGIMRAMLATSRKELPDTSSAPVGLAEIELNNDIQVYPNPSKGVFTLSISNQNIEALRMMLTDVFGKEVKTFYPSVTTVNLNDFAKGIYFLRIETSQTTVVKKLMLQ